MSRIIIDFIHDFSALPFPRKALLHAAQSVAEGECVEDGFSLNVIMCSDETIKELNRKYRAKDSPTDVLSFPFEESDFLGEIYISLHRAAEQAVRFGLGYDAEIERLFVHGLLHLLGYNHEGEVERSEMEERENRYCCLSQQM
ncbi:MAG: rRNA maturation RNase YbeY [Fibrobacterota bacterium]